MTDNADNGKSQERLILAPHPWPLWPAQMAGEGKRYYLSWPGWELFMSRRLGLRASEQSPRPILLPDVLDSERDFLAIEQLVERASNLGAGLLNLQSSELEGPSALAGKIRNYDRNREGAASGPLLDDRSYLALWSVGEFRELEIERALSEAAVREKSMWAALKGEADEDPDDGRAETGPVFRDRPPDSRGLYAWKCWQRLAAGIIQPGDRIVPASPPPDDSDI